MQHYASLLRWAVDALMHRHRVLSAVCGLLFAVCCLLFAVCCLLFAVCKTEEHHREHAQRRQCLQDQS
ncbi:hypothetical protein VDG05_04685 [Xanthomonas campestris pv. raphani]|uniref:hypothetical protein n=1 Tax=Xanthomonas campestris TaxID=339 RepID=UPI002B23B297|nr:hypothetical protein [Xanthomonas campestris]MEA9883662.1 hypothetical protein [Xanthomonas campestris pv. raphani]